MSKDIFYPDWQRKETKFEYIAHGFGVGVPSAHAGTGKLCFAKGNQTVTTEMGRGILMGQAGHRCDKRANSEQERLSTGSSEQERHSDGSSTSSCAPLNIITHHRDLHTDATLFQKPRGLRSSIDVPRQHHRPIANANVTE